MRSNLLLAALLFFIQPIFLLGIFYALVNYRKRVNYTRKNFRVNFNRENFEIKDYFLKGIIPGILLSVAFLLLGAPLTFNWYIIYQIIAILLLLIGGYRFIHPVFTFTLATILMYGLNYFNVALPFERFTQYFGMDIFQVTTQSLDMNLLTLNILLYTSMILLVSTFLIQVKSENKVYPVLNASKRGKNVASYQRNLLWLIPFLLVVPGQVMQPFASWWPLLTIGETEYAFLFVPILAGFRFTVSTQLLEDATATIQKEFRYLALLGLLLFGVSYFVESVSIIGLFLLLVSGFIILVRHRRRENQWSFRYGPANEGLRVIAVRLDSPAERMELAIGDVILTMNETEMINKEIYNDVLANSRSYVKMRIRRKDGEIVIVESPLYDNDYNNLGLLVLDN